MSAAWNRDGENTTSPRSSRFKLLVRCTALDKQLRVAAARGSLRGAFQHPTQQPRSDKMKGGGKSGKKKKKKQTNAQKSGKKAERTGEKIYRYIIYS